MTMAWNKNNRYPNIIDVPISYEQFELIQVIFYLGQSYNYAGYCQ